MVDLVRPQMQQIGVIHGELHKILAEHKETEEMKPLRLGAVSCDP